LSFCRSIEQELESQLLLKLYVTPLSAELISYVHLQAGATSRVWIQNEHQAKQGQQEQQPQWSKRALDAQTRAPPCFSAISLNSAPNLSISKAAGASELKITGSTHV